MHTVKEKVSNAASSGKAHVDIYKTKVEEQVEQAAARTEEEKEIAHQRGKAKEAQAKMELHQAKAEHTAEKLRAKQSHVLGYAQHHHDDPYLAATHHGQMNEPVVGTTHGHHQHHPVGIAAPVPATTAPTYPLGGNPPPPVHKKHF
ncbi:late embryogenesis abundant protein 6 [Pistacia vera]|uniref:late embryogenesis abundant protein 6 n=1 Tax=Pistacia vera TaxID=55513 RepID=UPI0012631A00|nr:late embryogenesis abundant protein 6 [Pistacia vera]